jgi:hypothetical protein
MVHFSAKAHQSGISGMSPSFRVVADKGQRLLLVGGTAENITAGVPFEVTITLVDAHNNPTDVGFDAQCGLCPTSIGVRVKAASDVRVAPRAFVAAGADRQCGGSSAAYMYCKQPRQGAATYLLTETAARLVRVEAIVIPFGQYQARVLSAVSETIRIVPGFPSSARLLNEWEADASELQRIQMAGCSFLPVPAVGVFDKYGNRIMHSAELHTEQMPAQLRLMSRDEDPTTDRPLWMLQANDPHSDTLESAQLSGHTEISEGPMAEFSDVYTRTAGTFWLVLELLAPAIVSAPVGVIVEPAPPKQIVWTSEPESTVSAGSEVSALLVVYDVFKNVITSELPVYVGVSTPLAVAPDAARISVTRTFPSRWTYLCRAHGLTQAGNEFRLFANVAALPSTFTRPFKVESASVETIRFDAHLPIALTVGSKLTPDLVVRAYDRFGNPYIRDPDPSVDAMLQSTVPNATLLGATTVPMHLGKAVLSGLSIVGPQGSYTLVATLRGLVNPKSAELQIQLRARVPALSLVFATYGLVPAQELLNASSDELAAPCVELRDAQGRVERRITMQLALFSVPASPAQAAGPEGLTSTLMRGGVACFPSVSLRRPVSALLLVAVSFWPWGVDHAVSRVFNLGADAAIALSFDRTASVPEWVVSDVLNFEVVPVDADGQPAIGVQMQDLQLHATIDGTRAATEVKWQESASDGLSFRASVRLTVPGRAQIEVRSKHVSGIIPNLRVVPGAATMLHFNRPFPSVIQAGLPFRPPAVGAVDASKAVSPAQFFEVRMSSKGSWNSSFATFPSGHSSASTVQIGELVLTVAGKRIAVLAQSVDPPLLSTSRVIEVHPASPIRLVGLGELSSSVEVGKAFAPPPAFALADEFGNMWNSKISVLVTLRVLWADPAFACEDQQQAAATPMSDGLILFPALTVDCEAKRVRLVAESGQLLPFVTDGFESLAVVSKPPVASAVLTFFSYPTFAISDRLLEPQPCARIASPSDDLVLHEFVVTLQIVAQSGRVPDSVSLTGTVTKRSIGGWVNFTDISVSFRSDLPLRLGKLHLRVTADGLQSVTGAPFDPLLPLSQAPTQTVREEGGGISDRIYITLSTMAGVLPLLGLLLWRLKVIRKRQRVHRFVEYDSSAAGGSAGKCSTFDGQQSASEPCQEVINSPPLPPSCFVFVSFDHEASLPQVDELGSALTSESARALVPELFVIVRRSPRRGSRSYEQEVRELIAESLLVIGVCGEGFAAPGSSTEFEWTACGELRKPGFLLALPHFSLAYCRGTPLPICVQGQPMSTVWDGRGPVPQILLLETLRRIQFSARRNAPAPLSLTPLPKFLPADGLRGSALKARRFPLDPFPGLLCLHCGETAAGHPDELEGPEGGMFCTFCGTQLRVRCQSCGSSQKLGSWHRMRCSTCSCDLKARTLKLRRPFILSLPMERQMAQLQKTEKLKSKDEEAPLLAVQDGPGATSKRSVMIL